jgi:hypothetical protein
MKHFKSILFIDSHEDNVYLQIFEYIYTMLPKEVIVHIHCIVHSKLCIC